MDITGWVALSDDDKEDEIVEAFRNIEMGVVAPLVSHRYWSSKATITDRTDQMRLDIQWTDFVRMLRKEGKISTEEELRAEAKPLIHLNSDQMRAALHKKEKDFQRKKLNQD